MQILSTGREVLIGTGSTSFVQMQIAKHWNVLNHRSGHQQRDIKSSVENGACSSPKSGEHPAKKNYCMSREQQEGT